MFLEQVQPRRHLQFELNQKLNQAKINLFFLLTKIIKLKRTPTQIAITIDHFPCHCF